MSSIWDVFEGRQAKVPPVWFLRQAGRCFRRYRDLRQSFTIMQISRCPELAAEVALMPVDALGVDACVLYTDLMLPLVEMGLQVEVSEKWGPIIHSPLRNDRSLVAARKRAEAVSYHYIGESIDLIRRHIDKRVELVGFVPGIYTLAAYAVTGRPARDFKDQVVAKTFMFDNPVIWHQICEVCFLAIVEMIKVLEIKGVRVVQVFESWVGSLNVDDFDNSVLEWDRGLVGEIRRRGMKAIFFGTGTGHLAPSFDELGADALSVDWRAPISRIASQLCNTACIQGNLDPERLLASWPAARAGIDRVMGESKGGKGFIFNLGHGVIHETSVSVLRDVVSYVREWDE